MRNLFVLAFTSLTLTGCDRPVCKNTNPVFDHYDPASDEYKSELVRQLHKTDPKKLSYWIDRYVKTDSAEYMRVYIQGADICAKGLLDISQATELKQYRKVSGKSYSGAGLSGLQYHIDSSSGRYRFFFDHVDRIAD